MKIFYYAWVRQKIGKSSDNITIDEKINTLKKLTYLLQKRDPLWKDIFNVPNSVRFSINGVITKDLNSKINNEDSISIFPPFTGG